VNTSSRERAPSPGKQVTGQQVGRNFRGGVAIKAKSAAGSDCSARQEQDQGRGLG